MLNLRPGLSGALFVRRHDEQKSGNGVRKKAPKIKLNNVEIQRFKISELIL